MYLYYMQKNDTQNNDSINSCYWQYLLCIISYFKISIFDLYPRWLKWKVATTYLAVRTRNN